MRNLIIKHFALSYVSRGKDEVKTTLRASVPTSICFSLTIIFGLLFEKYGLSTIKIFKIIFGLFSIICLFLGFVYFKAYPIRPNEFEKLDDVQKYVVSTLPSNGLTEDQNKEGLDLGKRGVENGVWIIYAFFAPILTPIILGLILFL